jgi:hypothetical protein
MTGRIRLFWLTRVGVILALALLLVAGQKWN